MNQNLWVVILGGSSGFGLASARVLASRNYNIFILHRDRKSSLPQVTNEFENIRNNNIEVQSLNMNAVLPENKQIILDKIKECLGTDGKIKVFLHSIADGNIGYLHKNNKPGRDSIFCKELTEESFQYTINSMGTSFISWSKSFLENNLFAAKARIIGLTSEGTGKVLKYYAAVAASKAVLESACKYLAVEYAPFGITTNLINAGITDTAALRVFPNHDEFIHFASTRNPSGRLTQPEDIANVVYLLSTDEASWINGAVIRVDGGEQITGF